MANKLFPTLVVGVGAAAVIAIAWFIYSSEQQAQIKPVTAIQVVPAPPVTQEAPPVIVYDDVAEPEPIVIEPIVEIVIAPAALENSDPQVLLAVADFSPLLAQWLLPEEQLRKWVLAVDKVANGKLPKRYRPIDYPMSKFAIENGADEAVLSDKNYPRMNDLIAATITIDPQLLARYYQNWLPILEKAYDEQGRSDSFDQRFLQAISQILAASPLTEEPMLVRPSVLYRYADSDQENASDVEKLLWRMGPDNAEKVQNFLREFRNQLSR